MGNLAPHDTFPLCIDVDTLCRVKKCPEISRVKSWPQPTAIHVPVGFQDFCSVKVCCRRQVGQKSPRKLRPRSLQLSRLVVVKKTSMPVSIAAQSCERSAPAVVGLDEKSPQKKYAGILLCEHANAVHNRSGRPSAIKRRLCPRQDLPRARRREAWGPGFVHRTEVSKQPDKTLLDTFWTLCRVSMTFFDTIWTVQTTFL